MPHINARGHRVIRKDGREVKEHRAVMEAHLGRPLRPDELVHHIDGNKLNNDLSNLRVTTFGEHTTGHKLTWTPEQVVEMHRAGQSLHSIARELGTRPCNIHRALRRRGIVLQDVKPYPMVVPLAFEPDAAVGMLRDGKSLADVGAAFGVSGSAVRAALKRRGIAVADLRPIRRGPKLPWDFEAACRMISEGLAVPEVATVVGTEPHKIRAALVKRKMTVGGLRASRT